MNNSVTKSNQYKSLLIAKIQHPGGAGGCPTHFQLVPMHEERAMLALCFGTRNNTEWSQPELIYWRESMMLQQTAYPRPACTPQMESCTLMQCLLMAVAAFWWLCILFCLHSGCKSLFHDALHPARACPLPELAGVGNLNPLQAIKCMGEFIKDAMPEVGGNGNGWGARKVHCVQWEALEFLIKARRRLGEGQLQGKNNWNEVKGKGQI